MIPAIILLAAQAGQAAETPPARPIAPISMAPITTAMPTPDQVVTAIANRIAAAPAKGHVSPKIIYMPEVSDFYPPSAKEAGQQGATRLRCKLNIVGELEQCTVETSSGYPALDAASLKLSRAVRYTPMIIDRVAKVSDVMLPIRWVYVE